MNRRAICSVFVILLGCGLFSGASLAGEGPYEFPATQSAAVPRAEVESVILSLDKLYRSAIEMQGTLLRWDFDWEKPWLGAGSTYLNSVFAVMLWGGMARAPYMTRSAIAALLCHELGHFLGGPPVQPLPGERVHWSSAEGQADFFSASECLPRYFGREGVSSGIAVDRVAHEACSSRDPVKTSICLNIAAAGAEMIRAFHHYSSERSPVPSFETPSREVAPLTLTLSYPSYQCRLDTFLAGAKCQIRPQDCVRPRCWFKT